MVGIGSFSDQMNLVPKKFMFDDEYRALREQKAVGEICTHYFDANGTVIKSGINERVFAIDYDSYMKIPVRVGIAGGSDKLQAMIGAIKGRLINVLITDLNTAIEVQKAFG